MRLAPQLLRFGLSLALLAGAGSAQAKLKVVTTTQDPAALLRAIGGQRLEVQTLAKGYQDPHFLDAKPSYMLALHNADLVALIGLELEVGYLPALISGARNERLAVGQRGFLDLSAAIKPLEVVAVADRSQGDIHPNGNPHYWLDPENGRLMARAIAARLSELDPDGRAVYQENLATFEKELDARLAIWKSRLAPLAGKAVITYHRSWTYFAARFGFSVADFVEPKPGIPPTPAHTLELIKLVRERQIKVILMENFYDQRVPALIGEKSGAAVVMAPNSVGGEEGIVTYFDLFERLTTALAKAIGTP